MAALEQEVPQTADHAEVNRRAWDYLARVHSSASAPWPPGTELEYRCWLDEFGWLPWADLRTVLLLCGAGGQQGPALAGLGLQVTVVDLSEEQLRVDRRVAARRGLAVETIRADVDDLSVLAGRTFDLVYQPVSTCYLPDPRRCYANVARLLGPGGLYLSDHWNPTQIQLGSPPRWDGSGYRVTYPSGTGEPIQVIDPSTAEGPPAHYFAHRLQDLVGGLCDEGFVIERFAERGATDLGAGPDTAEHLGGYLAPFYEILARRGGTESRPGPGAARGGAPWSAVQGSTSSRTEGPVPARTAAATPPGPATPAARRPARTERRPGVDGAPQPCRPLVEATLARTDLAARWRWNGFVILRHCLEGRRLVAALERESLGQRPTAAESRWEGYGCSDDGTYVSGGMSFHSAQPGRWLSWLHSHRDLQRLVRMITGHQTITANSNIAYMYYDEDSYIDLHTDVPQCEATVLTSVHGEVPPLIAYPRLRGLTPSALLRVAERTGGRPPGGVALAVPRGGLLVIDGRRLPHRRPALTPGAGCGIAALCFAEPTQAS